MTAVSIHVQQHPVRARARTPQQRPAFGLPLLLGFAFMMGVVLTVVLPTPLEFAEAPAKQPVDAYSIAYLRVLTRANPRDGQLRAVYIRQLAALGQWDDALEALGPVPREEAAASAHRAQRLDLMLAKARAFPEGSLARSTTFDAVHDEVRMTATMSLPPARLRELALLSLELEDPGLAARFFLALADAEHDRAAKAHALVEAGRWLRASGEDGRAAEALRRALDLAPDPAHRARALHAAADALEALARPCEAADLVARDEATTGDPVLAVRATALLTSCGRPRDAKVLGRRVVALMPESDAERRRQVQRELAAGDLSGALVVLGQLVKDHPDEASLHESMARVAEWARQPHVALEHWMWLLVRGYHVHR